MTVTLVQHRSTTGCYQNTKGTKKNPKGERKDKSANIAAENNAPIIGDQLFSIANTLAVCSAQTDRLPVNTQKPMANIVLFFACLSQMRLPMQEKVQVNTDRAVTASMHLNWNVPYITAHVYNQVASDLGKVNDIIMRYDPIKFPAADASLISTTPASSDEHHMEELSPALSEALFTRLIGWDPERRIDGKTVTPFLLKIPETQVKSRALRRLLSEAIAESNAKEAEYIKNYCNIRTKTISGNIVGNYMLVAAEYIRNPVRAAYERIMEGITPGHRISKLEVVVTEVINMSGDVILGIKTAGAYPIIKYASIHTLKVLGHAVNGDGKCVLNDFSPQELANLLFNTEVGLTNRGVLGELGIGQLPTELQEVEPYIPEGVFIQEIMPQGINTEKYLLVNHENKEYFIHDKGENQLWATELSHSSSQSCSQRVYFDEAKNKIHFDSAMTTGKGLDYEVIDGRSFINIYGRNYKFIYKPDVQLPYVVLDKASGETLVIPVYQEKISKKWHMAVHNGYHVFDEGKIALVTRLRVPYSKNFEYKGIDNINPLQYGEGKIYDVHNVAQRAHFGLYHVVEINGELLPVRVTLGKDRGGYEVYDLYNQHDAGMRIEWDGIRWVFFRATSQFVSRKLKNSITAECYAENVDANQLSYPDNRGLRWDRQDIAYLRVNEHYIKLKKVDDYKYRLIDGDYIGYLHFKNNKFHGETFLERLDMLLNDGLSGRGARKFSQEDVLCYEKNCVAMALSKVFRVNMFHTIQKLKSNGAINSATSLENSATIVTVMQRVDMPKVVSNMAYSEIKKMASGFPDGRYFAINSKTHTFEEDKASHAFAIILNKGSLGVAGNNAESPGRSYNQALSDSDIVTMWGPYPD